MDAELLAELGWNIWNRNRDINDGLFSESVMRKLIDCTKIPVNLGNEHYEESSVVKIEGEAVRGYKLGILRGLLDDFGIVEEIVFGTIKTHDMEQCREMLMHTSCFKENDILINDRGVPVT